jgi:hypothetical protein
MTVHSLTLRELARALGGEVAGHQALVPGPGHSPADRSLAVRPSASHPDGFVVHSYAGDPFEACRDHVAGLLGLADGRHRTPRTSTRPRPVAARKPASVQKRRYGPS